MQYNNTRKGINDRLRRHQLLPATLRKRLPQYAPEVEVLEDIVARVKLFTPDSSWYWYVTEANGDDLRGLVFGSTVEYGSFSLSELEEVRGPMGLPIERDRYFKPTTLREIKREHQQHEGEANREYLV